MAVRDFINYYNEEEAQYNEMRADAKDLEESYRAGHLSEEKYDRAIKYIESVRTNHERLSYVMYLITRRKKYSKKAGKLGAEVSENTELLNNLKGLKEGN